MAERVLRSKQSPSSSHNQGSAFVSMQHRPLRNASTQAATTHDRPSTVDGLVRSLTTGAHGMAKAGPQTLGKSSHNVCSVCQAETPRTAQGRTKAANAHLSLSKAWHPAMPCSAEPAQLQVRCVSTAACLAAIEARPPTRQCRVQTLGLAGRCVAAAQVCGRCAGPINADDPLASPATHCFMMLMSMATRGRSKHQPRASQV